MEQEDLEFINGEGFNPASCLNGPGEGTGRNPGLYSGDRSPNMVREEVREDLRDTTWPEGENVFIDGSSRVIEGKLQNTLL